jgi:hypothetical protein
MPGLSSSTLLPYHTSNKQHPLPLRLLPALELLQNAHDLLEAPKPLIKLLVHAGLIISQVRVESFAVRCGAHGRAENRLDHERVVGFEGVAVGGAERLGELGGGFGEVVAQALGGEVEASVWDGVSGVGRVELELWYVLPDEPEKAFGCGVLAGLELVTDKVLQSVGLERSGELTFCDFLRKQAVLFECPVSSG